MPPKKSKRVSKRERLIKRLMDAGYTKAQAEKIIRAGVRKLLGNKKPSRPKRPTYAPANPDAPRRPPLQSQDATQVMQKQAQESALEARVAQMWEITRLAQENQTIAEKKVDDAKREAEQQALLAKASKELQIQETNRAAEALALAEQSNLAAGAFSIEAAEEKKRATAERERARILADERDEERRIAVELKQEARELSDRNRDEYHRTKKAQRRLEDYQKTIKEAFAKEGLMAAENKVLAQMVLDRLKIHDRREEIFGDVTITDAAIGKLTKKVLVDALRKLGVRTSITWDDLFNNPSPQPIPAKPLPKSILDDDVPMTPAASPDTELSTALSGLSLNPLPAAAEHKRGRPTSILRTTLEDDLRNFDSILARTNMSEEEKQRVRATHHDVRDKLALADSGSKLSIPDLSGRMRRATKLLESRIPHSYSSEEPLSEPFSDAEPVVRAKQEGEGAQAQTHDTPLSNTQIDWLMQKHPEFLGTISRDEIPGLKITGRKPECFIMNLDPSNQPGSHWVAVYMDLLGQAEINYYDSFGRKCPADIYAALSSVIKQEAPPTLVKFKENLIKNQATDTNTCGWFCVMFLQERLAGKPFAGCSGFEDLRENEIDELKAGLKIPDSFDLL